MFVTNWISTTKIQKISEITNFFRHYFLSRTEVKHVEMQTIKYRIMDVLGNRTTYYRVHRGEKHLTPEMQEQVKKVFAEYGYGEPAYDHYAEEIGFVYE